jgi:hypothetical protein
MDYWQSLPKARLENYKGQRRATAQQRRRRVPKSIPAARLRRNLTKPRAIKIVTETITPGLGTALIQGSVSQIPMIVAGDLAKYMLEMAHTRAKDFGTGPGDLLSSFLPHIPLGSE